MDAPTYLRTTALRSRLRGYIDKMADYDGGVFNRRDIAPGLDFSSRSLLLAVKSGSANEAQQAVLAEMKDYAMNRGVYFDVRGVG